MKAPGSAWLAVACVTTSLACCITVARSDDVASENDNVARRTTESDDRATERSNSPPVDLARDRAKILHEAYAATLEVMHQRYFHGDTAIVPARALEDVFAEMQRGSKVEARWISVNLKPMSVNHKPKSNFEKRAAKAIADGQEHFEAVEDGYYRRAGAIPLASGCVTCHGGFFKAQSKTPKFAGLVISVPLDEIHPVRDEKDGDE